MQGLDPNLYLFQRLLISLKIVLLIVSSSCIGFTMPCYSPRRLLIKDVIRLNTIFIECPMRIVDALGKLRIE